MVTHGSSRLKYNTLKSIFVTVNLPNWINIYFMLSFSRNCDITIISDCSYRDFLKPGSLNRVSIDVLFLSLFL
mgnify:CR=1 FL=1